MTYIANRERYAVHIPRKALDGWRYGVATGQPTLRVFGDSQTFGQIVSTPSDTGGNCWRSKLRNNLTAWNKIGSLCAEYHPIGYTSELAVQVGYSWGGTPPWLYNTSPPTIPVPGGASLYCTWQAGLGLCATWAAVASGTACATFNNTNALPAFNDADIWLNRTTLSSPPGQYQVDAGSNTAFANITGSADGFMQVTQLRGIGNTSHKITIKGSGGGTQIWLDGITTYYGGASGNGLYYAAVGMPSGDFSNYASIVHDNVAGYSSGYGVLGFPCVSHAVIIAHGLNDFGRVGADTYCDRLIAFVRLNRRAAEIKYGSGFVQTYLIVGEEAPDQGTWGYTAGPGDSGTHAGAAVGGQAAWIAFKRKVKEAADSVDAVYLDWGMMGMARMLAKSYMISNDAHMTTTGHQALADAVANVLTFNQS